MESPAPSPKLLTIDEAASVLQVHRETIKRNIQLGKLAAVKIGYRTTRISEDDLNKFVESHRGENYFGGEDKP